MSADWLDSLNNAQREAVTHSDGPLLVIAGAGTGKTKTLACRVAWLVQQGVSADKILLLTFTRRAAGEMLRRAGHMTSQSTTGAVWGGTFHAIANRLLRVYGSAIGLSRDFTVMDQGDAADLMNLLRSELGLAGKNRRFPKKGTLNSIYSRVVNSQAQLTRILDKEYPWCREEADDIGRIFSAYIERKREQNVADYDDLLLFWGALCDSEAGATIADRFEHVLVDEYQDTNRVQAGILRGMRKRHQNIMVVGDDAQSIYSFRAATIRNILDFPKNFEGARTVTLEQNYRSTTPILDASNAVMQDAKERFTKTLWSNRMSAEMPSVVTCGDEHEQCNAVCDRIIQYTEQGIPLMRQAVLFRAGHHSDALEIELSHRNIPFHKYGGLKFIEAAHVKDVLAILRIMENPHDELSWHRILLMMDGVGPKTAQRVMGDIHVRRRPVSNDNNGGNSTGDLCTPLRAWLRELPNLPPAARDHGSRLRTILSDCTGIPMGSAKDAASCEAPPLNVQVERIRHFYAPLCRQTYDNHEVRLRDIEQLEVIATRYKSRSRFVTDLTIDPPASTSELAGPPELDEDWLTLSTVHSAKGCEWDVVHIIHAADGMFPSDMAVGDQEGIDEERRLFYVAMTRAKDHLHVYFPLRYYHTKHRLGDGHGFAQLTRFLPHKVRHLFAFEASGPTISDDEDDGPVSLRQVDMGLNRLWGGDSSSTSS